MKRLSLRLTFFLTLTKSAALNVGTDAQNNWKYAYYRTLS
jgi:hypothetical protein